jgi:hypothetical protein
MRKVQALTRSRAMYNEIVDMYPKDKYPDAIITDSYLRLEQSLQATITTLTFNMLVNQGTPNVTENRLNITDRFVATSLALLIMKAGTTTAATQAEISIGRPRTFNNSFIFTGASEAANLEVIYNSQLKITVDSTVYIDSYDTRRFYRVPTSQQGQAISAVASTGVLGADGYDESAYPFAGLTPSITFSGIGKNLIQLTLPNPTSLVGTNTQNFAIMWIRGFLVQNVNQRK